MEEMDPVTTEPKLLTGWSLKRPSPGELILYLEYDASGDAPASLTLAIPQEAAAYLAETLARAAA